MKLLGKRILINVPKRPESIIELTPEVEKQLETEMIKQWTSLEVALVGSDVEKIKEGDRVYIPAGVLTNAERIPVGEETKMLVNEYDISIVW